ncbi:MAG: tyrosine-type recombinase/integrase [Burkholderiales bacterium]
MPKPTKYQATDGTITWRVRFRIGGGSRSETFATKKDADRFVSLLAAVGGARARAVMDEANPRDVMDHLLGDVADAWLKWKGATRADGSPIRVSSSYTIDRYGQLIRNQIKPALGRKPINLLNESDIQDWVDGLADELSPKTVADAHSVLHGIYKWAGKKAQGIAIVDPCTETVLPKRRKNVAKGLRPEEWHILYAAASDISQDAADLLHFIVSTGWRWSEAVAVRSMDIDDYGADKINIAMGRILRREANGRFAFVEDEAKSQAGIRASGVKGSAASMIRRRRIGLSPDDLLFTNDVGGIWYYPGFMARYWERPKKGRDAAPNRVRIMERARELGLTRPITPNILRHTHAYLMLLGNEPMAAVQKRMGHEEITTTTGVYGSMISDVSDQGLDDFDALIAPRVIPTIEPV